MKIVFALSVLIVTGCSDQKHDNIEKSHRSHAQASIENLVDSFKTAYESASSQTEKQTISLKVIGKLVQGWH